MRLNQNSLVKTSLALMFLVFGCLALHAGDPPASESKGEAAAPGGEMLSLTALVPSLTPVSDYTGEFCDRSTVSGDWGGLRQDLYDCGFTFDINLTQVYQGVASGGRRSGSDYMGLLDYGITMDTGKMGLWPGGLLVANAQTNWGGNGYLPEAGTLLPVNFLSLYPEAGTDSTFLMEYYLIQGLSEELVLIAGRLNATNFLDRNRFANDPRTQFLNIGLNNQALLGEFVSFSTYGALLAWTASPNLTISGAVFDSNAVPGDYGVPGGFFEEYGVGLDVGFTWGDELDGSVHLTGIWTSKDPVLLDNPRLLREALLGGTPLPRASDNYGFFMTADQYLWKPANQPETGCKNPTYPSAYEDVRTAAFDYNERGFGLFARAGYVPGDRNPFDFSASGGFGGRGVFPGRPYDRFGAGVFLLQESEDLDALPVNLVDSESGFEAYYNAALTPSVQLGGTLQYIDSGRLGVENPLILGLRLTTRF